MKRTILLGLLALSLSFAGQAQMKDGIWYFMTAAHFVDYEAPDGGGFLATENWNGNAMPKQFYLGRSLVHGLELGTSVSFMNLEMYPEDLTNRNFLDWDLMLSWKPNYKKVLAMECRTDPYIWIGGGINRINATTEPLVTFGAGVDFWLTEYAALNLHTALDNVMGDGKSYTHHGVGLKLRIKDQDKDTDGDGIVDRLDRCPMEPGIKEFQGCPGISDDTRKQIDDQISFAAKNIQFETSSDVIRAASFPDLDNIVKIMKQYPNTKFNIHGHTDNTGDDAMNLDLSKRRAASVKKYFMDKGIAADRLFPEGFGETRPIATNDTPEGRAENRRVEIKMRSN